MRVKDAMTRTLKWIGPDALIEDAARTMRDTGIGALPVCEDDRLVGMLTDRDIVVRYVAEGKTSARVREAMTAQLSWCGEDDELEVAARRMEALAIRRLVVLDRRHRAVGLLSLDDLAMQPDGERLAGRVLEHVVAPEATEPS